MQPEWDRANPESSQRAHRTPKAGSEIKRSSWNAGMASDLVQPPPGSPAAWQGRRLSRGNSTRIQLANNLDEINNVTLSGKQSSARQHSPTRVRNQLSVPTLQTIRSVSGSALGPDIDFQPEEPEENLHRQLSPPPNPFNFTSTYVTPSKPVVSSTAKSARASQRRGHHYKHSSVSMNFFQEPEQRVPLSIPVSLAVPTMREYYQSITQPQFLKLVWCTLRMLLAMLVYSLGSPVHSAASLAHLLAYETVVSTSVACVSVLANFEVWHKSSLRFPFALKRAEVLVAFGLSAVLIFIGGDIVSHTLQALATGHEHHHHQPHNDHLALHSGLLLVSALSMLPTVARQGAANPLAVCTVLISGAVISVPLLPPRLGAILDSVLTPITAFTMVSIGYSSSKLFSGMLAMSYGGPDRSEAIAELVSDDPAVTHVSDISLWQVHHDLWLASMRITVAGDAEDERRVREMAAKAVREAVYVKDVKWETTIEITTKQI